MGKHSSRRTPEQAQALADDFDREDARLRDTPAPTADERIGSLQQIRQDLAYERDALIRAEQSRGRRA